MNKFIKNASTLMFANVISFLISTLITLIVPKSISVLDYSYFQLYLFYINYLGFFCIGWIDGIVLRYSGGYYSGLDRSVFSRQYRLYSYLELFFSVLIVSSSLILHLEANRRVVYIAVGIALYLNQANAFFRFLRQAVNDIDIYAKNVMQEKLIYLLGVVFSLLIGKFSFLYLIIADLIGKFFSLIHILILNKDIVLAEPVSIIEGVTEAKNNISVGIKLLLANGSSMLIVGIIRYSIQSNWDIETFGRVSLSLSISNMFILFVQAVGVSLFPMLKRIEVDKIVSLYKKLRKVLTLVMFSLLSVYYPMYLMLAYWLPSYSKSLKYAAIMFPVCIYESKMQLLIEPYMKALRKESRLLFGNIIAVILSFLSSLVFAFVLDNLDYVILSLVIILAIRSIILEIEVEKKLNINIRFDVMSELIMTFLFIVFNWYLGGWSGFCAYLIAVVIFWIIEKKSVELIFRMAIDFLKIKNK